MNTQGTLETTVTNTALGLFADYNAHIDYSTNDFLLKIVKGDDAGKKEGKRYSITDFINSIHSESDTISTSTITRFLDLLLVKTSDFVYQYIEWLRLLRKLKTQVLEIEQAGGYDGISAKLHPGYIVFSATADTERKVREEFGGVKWRRIVNFPMIISDAKANDLKQRGGESFVSLISDNVPNHYHTIKVNNNARQKKDVWKVGKSPGAKDPSTQFVTNKAPGLTLKSKRVYPEVAPLNWSDDCGDVNAEGRYTSGSARYVVPHFNLPPYKDVYIWECVQVADKSSASAHMTLLADEEVVVNVDTSNAALDADISFTDIQSNKTKWGMSDLSSWGALDYLCTLVSDELIGDEDTRYDSKDVSVHDMTSLASWYVWCDKYHIERRYLFRDVYKYLVANIQDSVYLLLKRIANFGHQIFKERLHKGQYVFFYDKVLSSMSDKNISDIFNEYYTIPYGCKYTAVTEVFLRGTPMFTNETKGLFSNYCTLKEEDKDELYNTIKTSGGLQTVDLYAENFPKHLHWSTLMSAMNSIYVTKPAKSTNNGGYGSVITMNDPRSGGIKYCHMSGTGPYEFNIDECGKKQGITHNNMPQLVMMKVFVIE